MGIVHNNKSMREHLEKKGLVSTPSGPIEIPLSAGGILFDGQIITDPKKLPTDDEIKAHREGISASRRLK